MVGGAGTCLCLVVVVVATAPGTGGGGGGANGEGKLAGGALTATAGGHGLGDFAAQDASDALADGVLDFVFLEHAPEALAEARDLESLGDAADELDGVDGGADLLEQGPDEAGFGHGEVEQVVPEGLVPLLLGEGDGLRHVVEPVDDQSQRLRHPALLGEQVHPFRDVAALLAHRRRRAEGVGWRRFEEG